MSAWKMPLFSAILGLCVLGTAAWKEKRNAIPKFMFDPNTPASCAWWLDVEGFWSCQGIEDVFGVSSVDFLRWNPSVPSPCGELPVNQSYCLATSEGWRSSSVEIQTTVSVTVPTTVSVPTTVFVSATASASTTTTTTTVSVRTTVSVSTTVTVRVTVTDPLTVPVTLPVTVTRTTSMAVPTTVSTTVRTTVLITVPTTIRVTNVVTSTIRATVMSTVTAMGGPTPLPSQPGMVGNCKAYYFVQWGDTCDSIAAKFNVRSDQIVAWNPQARSDCTRLLAETFCCVRAF